MVLISLHWNNSIKKKMLFRRYNSEEKKGTLILLCYNKKCNLRSTARVELGSSRPSGKLRRPFYPTAIILSTKLKDDEK